MTETNYDAIKRECREILKCFKKFRYYLYDVHFILKINVEVLIAQFNRSDIDFLNAFLIRQIAWIRLRRGIGQFGLRATLKIPAPIGMGVEWEHSHLIRMGWELISTPSRTNERKSRHHPILSSRFGRKFGILTPWQKNFWSNFTPYKFVWGIFHVWSNLIICMLNCICLNAPRLN